MAEIIVANITAQIDAGPLGALQTRTLVLNNLASLLDGLDMQSIGVVAPGIIATLHLLACSLACRSAQRRSD